MIPKPGQTWRDTPDPPQGSERFTRDANNQQVTPLGANGVFTGKWSLVDTNASFLVLYASNQPFTLQIQWSKDGITQDTDPFATITPQVRSRLGLFSVISPQQTFFRPYFRIKITNGAIPQAFVVSDLLLLTTVFSGYDIDVDGPIPVLGLANLKAVLNWGRNPTKWEPLQLTASNNQKIALAENLLGTLPVAVENFPIPIPEVPYSKTFLVGTGLPQLIKAGPGTLRSVIVSGGPTFVAYDDLLGLTGKFIDIDTAAGGNFLGPLDIPFTVGLTVKVQNAKKYTVIFN